MKQRSIKMKAIILAAGESTRMWPLAVHKNKCMYEFLGKPLLQYALEGLREKGIRDIIIVRSARDDSIAKALGNGKSLSVNISYVEQPKPLGTGDALLRAEKLAGEEFLVMNATKGDAGKVLEPMLRLKKKKDYNIIIGAEETVAPETYGVLEVNGDDITGIVEKPQGKGTGLRSNGVYLMQRNFFNYLKSVKPHEHSVVHALQDYIKKEKNVGAARCGKTISLKYPWHVLEVNKTLLDLSKPRISRKARIHKSAVIEGKVIIEDKVTIAPNVVIEGPAYVGEGTEIRSNCLLRPYSSVGRNCVLGFGTEIKNSVIYDRTKTHNNYLGDSVVDEDCRPGWGTVTANRRLDRKNIFIRVNEKEIDTGTTSLGAFLGKGVHTGILCALMPGVRIGPGALIGPNTPVMGDVQDGETVYAKFETVKKKK